MTVLTKLEWGWVDFQLAETSTYKLGYFDFIADGCSRKNITWYNRLTCQ